ncbi:MAG: cysteine dioxygenase family protein [Planctomycetes bacterium]|nr:cysteine dioxygenase family protein [Planctomycetota bacterium]
MPETTTYCFQDFISDLEMITSVERDQAEMIRKISRKMKLLIASGEGFLTPKEREEDPRHYARHLVHIDRMRRFVVMSSVWRAGQGTPVHDHGTWGLMGVLEGELKVTNYVRLDDRSKSGHAELREINGLWSGPGSVSYVLPPHEEIHKVENLGEKVTYGLHVYGRDIIECNQYDLEKKTMRPYGPDYSNVGKDR